MPNCVFCDQENPAGLSTCQLCKAPLPGNEGESLPEDLFRDQLIRLLSENQRVQAVAAYRRRTGVELNTAMAAIDALERDHEFDVTPADADLEWEIIGYLERGEKISAIRFYREKTGLGLKEAKDAVEAIEVRMGLAHDVESAGGCFGMLLLAMLISVAACTVCIV